MVIKAMGIEAMVPLVRQLETVESVTDLDAAMSKFSLDLGFQYYALAHHVDVARAPGAPIRLHNYPARWADYYDRNALGISDPVHRASHVTSLGFRWSRLADMVPLTAADRGILRRGRDEGIGDGFTVPANVPGEARGSCSFAIEAGRPLPEATLPMAQLAGACAFAGARRLSAMRSLGEPPAAPALTDRQRDCVLWLARGKSDWEISRILAISEETVIRHIKQARERYGVQKRTLLAIRTLFDGTLSFDDVLKR